MITFSSVILFTVPQADIEGDPDLYVQVVTDQQSAQSHDHQNIMIFSCWWLWQCWWVFHYCEKGNDDDGTEGDNNGDNITIFAIFLITRQDGDDDDDYDDAIMNLLIFMMTRRGAVST